MTADYQVEVTTTVPFEPARRASQPVEDADSRMDLRVSTFGAMDYRESG
jgi:hypothetical protein